MLFIRSSNYVGWFIMDLPRSDKLLVTLRSWRRHQMETFSALLALCAGNSLVSGEFPSQRPVTQSFDLRLNKRLSKNNRDAGDLRRHRAHYDVIVMWIPALIPLRLSSNSKVFKYQNAYFLVSENDFLIPENDFLISGIHIFPDIRCWFSYIRNAFLKSFCDIEKW